MNKPFDNAWSLYWSDDRLYSCVAQSAGEDQQKLDTLWQKFAGTLKPSDRVLDLATGNGAVPKSLLTNGTELSIDAVDNADIDPTHFVKNSPELSKVRFHANTDILSLPFEAPIFDAITSQFGLEYAGLKPASLEALSYLKPGGKFQFVIHHSDSGIIESSKVKIIELEQLTQSAGILDTLIDVLSGRAEFATLEALGQAYIAQDSPQTAAVSGQVFAGIEQAINQFSSAPKESLELAVSMNLRVRSELARLNQLIEAGQSSDSMDAWKNSVSGERMAVSYSPLYLDRSKQDYLLAWLAIGVRT